MRLILNKVRSTTTKAQESRIRRALRRKGYLLGKSRDRTIHADNLGEYMVVNADTNMVVTGSRFDASLDDIGEMMEELKPNRMAGRL